MDWLQRQGDEIVQALFTPPNFTIIPPTSLGQNAQFDGSFKNFLERFTAADIKRGYEDMKSQMGEAYDKTNVLPALSNKVSTTTS